MAAVYYDSTIEQDRLDIMRNSVSIANLDSLQYAILNWIAQQCQCRLAPVQMAITAVFGLQQLLLGEFVREHARSHGSLATNSNMAALITGGSLLTLLLLLMDKRAGCIAGFDTHGLTLATNQIFSGLINSFNLKGKLQRLAAGYLGFTVLRTHFKKTPYFLTRISSLWLSVIESRQQPYTLHSLCTDYLFQSKMIPFSRFTSTAWTQQRTKLIDDLALWVRRTMPVMMAQSYIVKFPEIDGQKLAESVFGKNMVRERIEN